MLRDQNKFFNRSKAHHAKSGFINSHLAKEFENKKFTDLVKMMRKDRPDLKFKKLKIDEKIFHA